MSGIKSLEDLRQRCYVDEDTGCWHWRGAFTTGLSKTLTPVTWLPVLGKVVSTMRATLILTNRKPGRVSWAKCGNVDCCSPEHMRTGTHKQYGCWLTENGRRKGNPAHLVGNIVRARARAKLTEEIVAEMRASGLNGVQCAEKYGISKGHACQILNGQRWRSKAFVASSASVFSWRPNA